MENQSNLVFYYNSKMYVRMVIGLLLFGGLAAWLFIHKPHNYTAQYILLGIGILCAVLTVWMGYMMIKKLNGPKEALIVTKEGIVDNVGTHKIPMILWKDVKGIRDEAIAFNKMIRIDVWNPQDYISQVKGAGKRRIMKNNFNASGSPFMIPSAVFTVKHEEVLQQLNQEFAPYKAERDAKKAAEKVLKEGKNASENENII